MLNCVSTGMRVNFIWLDIPIKRRTWQKLGHPFRLHFVLKMLLQNSLTYFLIRMKLNQLKQCIIWRISVSFQLKILEHLIKDPELKGMFSFYYVEKILDMNVQCYVFISRSFVTKIGFLKHYNILIPKPRWDKEMKGEVTVTIVERVASKWKKSGGGVWSWRSSTFNNIMEIYAKDLHEKASTCTI